MNERGEITLPREFASALGILPGDEIRVEQIENAVALHYFGFHTQADLHRSRQQMQFELRDLYV